jgi:hypothetical protein
MLRSAVITGIVTLLGVGSAMAMGPHLEAHRVKGYFDRVPEGTRVLDRLELGRGTNARVLYVVASEPVLEPAACQSCPTMFERRGRYDVVGDRGDVGRLLESPLGAGISAVVTRPRSDRHLLVQDVVTDDTKAVVESDPLAEPRG